MIVPDILALDFAGVCCDGMREYFETSRRTGELIEGTERFGAGSYLHYRPGSSHQPRTEAGVRILVLGATTQGGR